MKTKIVHAVPNVDLPLPCRKAELPYFVFNSRGINISFLWIALITHWTSCPLMHHVPEHPGPIVSHSFANSHYLHNILYFVRLKWTKSNFPPHYTSDICSLCPSAVSFSSLHNLFCYTSLYHQLHPHHWKWLKAKESTQSNPLKSIHPWSMPVVLIFFLYRIWKHFIIWCIRRFEHQTIQQNQ